MTNADLPTATTSAVQTPSGSDDEPEPHPHAFHPLSPHAAMAEAELTQAPDDRPSPRDPRWREWLTTTVAIGAGGFLGANARYLVGLWVSQRWGNTFPWGTLLINLSGSFVLGYYLTLVTERVSGSATTRLFVATGFLGAYTTFSTFAFETVTLFRQGDTRPALINALGSAALGVSGATAGILLAALLADRAI